MSLPHSLVSDLYAAANGRVAWGTALDNLASHFSLWLVQLLSVDGRNGNLLFSAYGGKGGAPEIALDYFRFFNTIDPRIPPGMATPPDRWMHSQDHHDATFVATSPFYRDFLSPHGGGHMASTKLIEVGHVQFLVAFVASHGAAPVGAAQMPLLEQLKHHLCEALRNMVHLRESYAELGMARELLNQFDYPMLLVDETRGIWHQNQTARAALQSADVVYEQGGYLVCRKRDEDNAFTDAIASLRLSAAEPPDDRKRRVVTLSKPDGSPYLAFVSAVRPQETMGVFGQTASALVVLHDPAEQRSQLDPFIVGECFDLTPAEARVAVQIANGAVPKEIARRSGAALPTVRTHLQRVMEKTGVTRQADLVRVLLALPSRTK